jgi:hypothetical protein
MNSTSVALVAFVALFGSAMIGVLLKRRMSNQHLSSEAKDTVKLAMGLVASMTALVLGLLVASAKGSYDSQRTSLIQLAAKTAFLDRVLEVYGPDAQGVRRHLRESMADGVQRLWRTPEHVRSLRGPDVKQAKVLYESVQALQPADDMHRNLRAVATQQLMDLGQIRWLLFEQTGSAVAHPLLIVVICWLAFIFMSFGVFAPGNPITVTSFLIAAASVAGAVFLILELDRPFTGYIEIPREILSEALEPLTD